MSTGPRRRVHGDGAASELVEGRDVNERPDRDNPGPGAVRPLLHAELLRHLARACRDGLPDLLLGDERPPQVVVEEDDRLVLIGIGLEQVHVGQAGRGPELPVSTRPSFMSTSVADNSPTSHAHAAAQSIPANRHCHE